MARSQTAVSKNPSTSVTTTRSGRPSLLMRFAGRYGIDPDKMLETLKATAFRQRGKNGGPPPEITNEQMVALLTVAERYDLDPFVRQIYAFPNKAGGIEPIVPVDGWIKLIQNHPQFEDWEIIYPGGGEETDDGSEIPPWMGCKIWRKDRKRPTYIREYFSECKRDTDPWREMPRRMLRHKAIIQCGRAAFGLSGIFDPDEAERMAIDVTPDRPAKDSTPPQSKLSGPAPAGEEQLGLLRKELDRAGIPEDDLVTKFDLGSLAELKWDQVQPALDWIRQIAP